MEVHFKLELKLFIISNSGIKSHPQNNHSSKQFLYSRNLM